MAKLSDILGSVFRDISQARVSSDLYSRNISKYYEQDPLLKRFPVPRTEVEEVEVDLKFVLEGLETTDVQDEGREAALATIIVKIAKDLSDRAYDELRDIIPAETEDLEEERKKVEGFEYRIYLSQDILLYFQRSKEELHGKGKFDRREASEDLEKIISRQLSKVFADAVVPEGQWKKYIDGAIKALDLDAYLRRMRDPLREAYGKEDTKLDIEVTVDKLAHAPENGISSIKLKAKVRNYVWNKVQHEGKTWHALNPE